MGKITGMLMLLMFVMLVAMGVAPRLPNPQIVSVLASVSTNRMTDPENAAHIVSALETILKLLTDDGLVTRMPLPPNVVGVHPTNRYGFGCSASNVHRLGAKIVRMGWSWAACAMAICIADSASRKIAKFTVKMQRGSKLFGKSLENGIRYGSLSCGHTNQFLVAALDGVETDEENLRGQDGRISIEKITRNVHGHNDLGEALEKGMHWHVVDPIVEEMYPEFANLAQRARQAVGQVQNVESLLEQMCSIQQLSSQMIEKGEAPDFDVIASIVLESEPPNPQEIPKACSYVQLYGGGKSGQYINDLKRFVSLCAPGGRSISADLLSAICKLKFESGELCPDFITAILKCTYGGPDKSIKNGICTFIKDTHVNSLEKSKNQRCSKQTNTCECTRSSY